MEELFNFVMTPYFAFGKEKDSLISEFCRETGFEFLQDPIVEVMQNPLSKNSIITGSFELFE